MLRVVGGTSLWEYGNELKMGKNGVLLCVAINIEEHVVCGRLSVGAVFESRQSRQSCHSQGWSACQ